MINEFAIFSGSGFSSCVPETRHEDCGAPAGGSLEEAFNLGAPNAVLHRLNALLHLLLQQFSFELRQLPR